jgi:hypothetical protein
MNRLTVASLGALALAGSAVLSAQQVQPRLPDAPAKGFGTSITGAFEGWFDQKDGSHTFLVGYYNRNIQKPFDIPVGPNNKIELIGADNKVQGGPDYGQPTRFEGGRYVGVFTITVPKAFSKQQKLVWTIVANGQPTQIPLRLNTDYNVSPFKDAAVGNTPPEVRVFDEKMTPVVGPINSIATAIPKTATMAAGLALPVWADDDAKYSSGSNAPMRNPPPPVEISWWKYRGPGTVTFSEAKPKLQVLKGGKVDEPFSGKATTTAKFSEPGEYYLQLVANDYSGDGGGGEVCCWTNILVKVTVTP